METAAIVACAATVTSVVTGFATYLGVAANNSKAFKRELYKQRIEETKSIYVSYIAFLRLTNLNDGLVNDEDRKQQVLNEANLSLFASNEVQKKALEVIDLLQETTQLRRKLQPHSSNGISYVVSNPNREADEAAAAVKETLLTESLVGLEVRMAAHLRSLESKQP